MNVGCQSGFGFFENVLLRCLGGLKVCQIRMGSGRLRLEVIGREKRKGKKGRVSFLGHPLFSSLRDSLPRFVVAGGYSSSSLMFLMASRT